MQKRPPNLLLSAVLLLPLALLSFSCSAERGAALFDGQGCRGCHSFKGNGGNLAADLTAVSERRSEAWIRQQIKNPLKNSPGSRMPGYGHLGRFQIRSLVAYLGS